jgi:hypothetical protein
MKAMQPILPVVEADVDMMPRRMKNALKDRAGCKNDGCHRG